MNDSVLSAVMRGFVHGSPANGNAGWPGHFRQDRDTRKLFSTEQKS